MNAFEQLVQAESEGQVNELRNRIEQEGYPVFRRFLDRFHTYLKALQEDQEEEVLNLIAKARRVIPSPGKLSPSWAYIWDHLASMAQYKLKVLHSVSPEDRDGEWQILIDNPFVNREVACYPGLSFDDAAYIYAKFRPGLEHNEYIRLQKIQTHVTEFGDRK